MSAYAMSDGFFAPPGFGTRADGANAFLDGLRALARYIPAEGLALYIAMVALIGVEMPGPAVSLAAGALLNIIAIVLRWNEFRAAATGADKPTGIALAFALILATFLLVVYVSALPGNPVTGGSEVALRYAGGAVLFFAALLTLIAKPLEKLVWAWGRN